MNTTIVFNESLFNVSGLTPNINPNIPVECVAKDGVSYSLECIYNLICPQFSNYFIKVGIVLVISYIIMTWVLWYFAKYGYKDIAFYFDWHYFDEYENRVWWELWIRQRFQWAFIVYTVVVIWLSINMRVLG